MNVTKRQLSTKYAEAEFWNDLQHLSSEVEHALDIFHVYEEIIILGAQSAAAFSAFNNDALFWNTQSLSLQTSLFIILSRIFDKGPDALTVHRVLNAASAHPEFFSKKSLNLRISDRPVERHYLDDIVAGAWTPSNGSEFRYLKKAVAPHAKRVTEIYQRIRNLYFGHRIIDSNKTILELFALTNRVEIAETLDFLHDLIDAMTRLYLNGLKPELGTRSFENYNDKIRASARSVVRKVAGRELFPRRSELEP